MADPDRIARIAAALAAEDSPLRRRGAELVVDHVLDLPLSAVLDAEALLPIYVKALDRDNVARALERHVLPGLERVRGALADAGETVGAGVPADARARIEAMAQKPDGPRFKWLRGALDARRMRELLAPAIQQTLLEFVRQLPLAGGVGGDRDGEGDASARGGGGLAAGLVGRLGREVQKGTGRLVSAGRGVAEGLGLEKRLQQSARDFSQGAMAGVQRALRERLQSAEGAALLTELSRGVVAHVMATPVEAILKDLERLPLTEAVGLSAPIVAHNLSRELGRRALEAELAAFFELEGARSLRELLAEAGLEPPVRALAVERVTTASAALFSGEAFASWLGDVLDAGDA